MKVYTKWINVHLATRSLEIQDIAEMSDGSKLCHLVEILSGKKTHIF